VTTFWTKLSSTLLRSTVLAAIVGTPAFAAPLGSPKTSVPEAAKDASALRPSDPHKELRHLSKNLRLGKNQRIVVGSILEERTREIRLLLEVEPISQSYSNRLAAKIIEDSNIQIETFLKNKQKRKFDREFEITTH
jgi:hypothetical protein